MYCVVATLGFDIDFAVRRLSREPAPSRMVFVGLKADEAGWRRVEKTFGLLKVYCESMKTQCLLEAVMPETIVKDIAGVIERETRLGCEKVELYLTGGPRIAVAASILASLVAKTPKARIVVEGEAFDARLEIPLDPLRRLLSLPEVDRRIIVEASGEPVRPVDIHRRLGISKPAAYRKLRSLEEAGFLEKLGGRGERYIAREEVRELLKLLR